MELQLDRLTDEEVAFAANVSAHAAFDVLFDRYRGPIYSFISRQVKDVAKIEDLFQNTFMKMYRALQTFRRDSKFKTWLFTIASNVIVDDRRRDGKRSTVSDLDADAVIAPAVAVHGLESEEAVALLKTAMEDLSPEHRQLFLLVRFHEMKIADAAVAVGLSPTSAKVTLFRIQQKLGRALGTKLKVNL